MKSPDHTESLKRLRATWPELEREVNDWFKHKCNYEEKPRPVVAREYGIPALETFLASELTLAYQEGERAAEERVKGIAKAGILKPDVVLGGLTFAEVYYNQALTDLIARIDSRKV